MGSVISVLTERIKQMKFMPGQSGNPQGRPKQVDVLSEHMQAFYKNHQEDIDKVGEVALKKAVVEGEP